MDKPDGMPISAHSRRTFSLAIENVHIVASRASVALKSMIKLLL